MNNWLLLIVSLGITLTYGLLRNSFCKHLPDAKNGIFAFNAAASLLSALVIFIYMLASGASAPSAYTWVAGVIFGLLTAGAALFNMKALETGPLSYTSLLGTASMMIPALSGALLYDESVSPWQWCGVVLMLASVALAVGGKKDDKNGGRMSAGWLVWCVLMFVSSGAIGVEQKMFGNAGYGSESSAFLVIAFAVSAVFSLLVMLAAGRGEPRSTGFKLMCGRRFIIYSVVSGVFIALANLINLYLSGAMDSMVFFPIVNGGGLMLNLIAAFAFLHEKLGRRQWVGIAAGVASVFLLCNII